MESSTNVSETIWVFNNVQEFNIFEEYFQIVIKSIAWYFDNLLL